MTPTEAEQAWLALEHEAVWFYPVVGGRFDDLRERATTAFKAHRDTRDALLTRLRARGVEPVIADLAYDLGPLTTSAQAQDAARTLESGIAAATLALSGVVDGSARTFAVDGLTTAALAELTWGAAPRAFPGLP